MRIIQRKHRQNLRRRIADGEVDLEALGIKRLNVPQDLLDKMPLHTYIADEPSLGPLPLQPPGAPGSPTTNSANATAPNAPRTSDGVAQREHREDGSKSMASISIGSNVPHGRFAQHTCPICLDDFESNVTQVRELPCGHIFHPECVDVFLRDSSSLCPMCKKSVLPLGYCPDKVTNAMVRRERLVRRMRERVTLEVVQVPTGYNGRWV